MEVNYVVQYDVFGKTVRLTENQAASLFTLLVYWKKGRTTGMKYHSERYEFVERNGKVFVNHKFAFDRLLYNLVFGKKELYNSALLIENITHQVLGMWHTYARPGKMLHEPLFRQYHSGNVYLSGLVNPVMNARLQPYLKFWRESGLPPGLVMQSFNSRFGIPEEISDPQQTSQSGSANGTSLNFQSANDTPTTNEQVDTLPTTPTEEQKEGNFEPNTKTQPIGWALLKHLENEAVNRSIQKEELNLVIAPPKKASLKCPVVHLFQRDQPLCEIPCPVIIPMLSSPILLSLCNLSAEDLPARLFELHKHLAKKAKKPYRDTRLVISCKSLHQKEIWITLNDEFLLASPLNSAIRFLHNLPVSG